MHWGGGEENRSQRIALFLPRLQNGAELHGTRDPADTGATWGAGEFSSPTLSQGHTEHLSHLK